MYGCANGSRRKDLAQRHRESCTYTDWVQMRVHWEGWMRHGHNNNVMSRMKALSLACLQARTAPHRPKPSLPLTVRCPARTHLCSISEHQVTAPCALRHLQLHLVEAQACGARKKGMSNTNNREIKGDRNSDSAIDCPGRVWPPSSDDQSPFRTTCGKSAI